MPGGVTFEEFRSRSVFRHNAGREIHDLLSHGSIVLDSDTGRVTSVQLTAGDSKTEFQATLAARYAEDTALKFLVPVEFSERYWRPAKPREDHLEVVSTYANFRRFQVTTEEQVKVPK